MKKKSPKPRIIHEENLKVKVLMFENFFQDMDWNMLKKQRRSLQVMLDSDILPTKESDALEGVLNLLEDMAFFAVDNLEVSTSTLLLAPENLSEKKKEEWQKKDSDKFEKEVSKLIKNVKSIFI